MAEKTNEYRVIKEFTYDRDYLVGEKITLTDKKTIEHLTVNNLITWL
jgi:hypothetical protein